MAALPDDTPRDLNFDPYTQNITFLLSDGVTPVYVPIPLIDQWNFESFSTGVNYGSQVGASFIMLLIVLLLTPPSKLRRRSSLLHMAGLFLCIVRMVPFFRYFVGGFSEFYAVWSDDYSNVRANDLAASIAGNTLTLLLVIVVEAALATQAWSVGQLWAPRVKLPLLIASGIITVLTIGWRFAFVVVQNQIVMDEGASSDMWLFQWMVITNAVSIFWYGAVFNIKLVSHLVSNRGILPHRSTLHPMEVLIMTNGILIIVPVIFAGLEWGQFTNFEASSLTLTSAAIILPLGTLVAQRLTPSSSASSSQPGSFHSGDRLFVPVSAASSSSSSTTPLTKVPGFLTGVTASRGAAQVSVVSRCEAGYLKSERRVRDPLDLSLFDIEDEQGTVRVERKLEQHIDRVEDV